MSELINQEQSRTRTHRYLLASVSAAALVASVSVNALAAEDVDRPTVWIELGGQWEQTSSAQEPYAPPFVAHLPEDYFSPLDVQKPLNSSLGGEGAINFEPEGSDWVFSASIRFGRSNGIRHQHQQTPNARVPENFNLPPPYSAFGVHNKYYYPSNRVRFSDAKAQQSQTQAILDFQVGKDVGLGMFGGSGSSVLSVGVRFAEFNSRIRVDLHAVPDLQYPATPITNPQERTAFLSGQNINFHVYTAFASMQRSFRGVGPSLAWKASAPVAGSPERGGMTFDWGIDGAVLFGRQKIRGQHHATDVSYHLIQWTTLPNAECNAAHSCEDPGYFRGENGGAGITATHHSAANINRSRTVIVPNFGGFAGVSFVYSSAKVSFGYRADFFFDAMDGGIDTAKSENRGFYGPFATISIGIGG